MPTKKEDLRKVDVPQFPSRGTTGMGQVYTGLFHEWAKIPLPLDNGSYIEETVGIVEFEDGTIKTYPPTNIHFKD